MADLGISDHKGKMKQLKVFFFQNEKDPHCTVNCRQTVNDRYHEITMNIVR